MPAFSRWISIPVLALIGACSKPAAVASADETPKLNTTIEITKAVVPARYAAALPTTAAAMQHWLRNGDDTLPPLVHVRDLLLLGDAKMFERVSIAAKAVPAPEVDSWSTSWSNTLQYEAASESFCRSLRPVMQAPPSTLRRAFVDVFAAQCAGDADLELIVRADSPDSAVLEYYTSFHQRDGSHHPWHARYYDAARKAILDSENGDRRIAFVLARHVDPRARAALRRIHAEIRDPDRADQVAFAFYDAEDPKDRALAERACDRQPKESVCGRTHQIAGDEEPLPGEESEEPDDRPSPSLVAVKAIIDNLVTAGFSKVASVDPATAGTDSPNDILLIAGQAYWFDVETGMYPNNHDSLMRRLVALAAPEFDDVIFEEAAPPMEDETGSKPYVLTVYASGKRLRAEARNFGDWYDVEAMLNLLNRVSKERGSKIRFVSLASDDQTMTIVAAPGSAIATAIKAGLIDVGGADEPREGGKSFEEKVKEAFEN